MKTFLSVVALSVFLQACAITHPCSDAGDTTWTPKIIGDKRCEQKALPDKRVVNHGSFKQFYKSTGNLALQGQFDLGQKVGIWTFYGEDQKLKSAKYFDRGVEKTPPAEIQKEIDLLIEQKAGTK